MQTGFNEKIASVPPTTNVYASCGEDPFLGVYHTFEVCLLPPLIFELLWIELCLVLWQMVYDISKLCSGVIL